MEVIDSPPGRLAAGIGPSDVVLDALGAPLRRSYTLLRPGGRRLLGGFRTCSTARNDRCAGRRPTRCQCRGFNLMKQLEESKTVIGPNMLRLWTIAAILELLDRAADQGLTTERSRRSFMQSCRSPLLHIDSGRTERRQAGGLGRRWVAWGPAVCKRGRKQLYSRIPDSKYVLWNLHDEHISPNPIGHRGAGARSGAAAVGQTAQTPPYAESDDRRRNNAGAGRRATDDRQSHVRRRRPDPGAIQLQGGQRAPLLTWSSPSSLNWHCRR